MTKRSQDDVVGRRRHNGVQRWWVSSTVRVLSFTVQRIFVFLCLEGERKYPMVTNKVTFEFLSLSP